jgi:hypothetical protein
MGGTPQTNILTIRHDDASVAIPPGGDAEALRAMGWANSGGVPAANAVNVLHR